MTSRVALSACVSFVAFLILASLENAEAAWLRNDTSPAVINSVARVTIDFDTYPGGGVVPGGPSIADQWRSLGVVFSDGEGGPVWAANNACSLTPPNHAAAAPIVATFVDPATGTAALTAYVGTAQDNCWYPGEGIAIRAYNLNGELIGSIFNPPAGVNGNGHFEALSFPSAIVARVEMDCVGQGIDNFVFEMPAPVSDVSDVPIVHRLYVNYPNPFNPVTRIRYDLPSESIVRLRVYNIAGRLVRTLRNGLQGPGRYTILWDGSDNAGRKAVSGVYFYRLSAGDFVDTHKMILLK